jgi:rubrerythrin
MTTEMPRAQVPQWSHQSRGDSEPWPEQPSHHDAIMPLSWDHGAQEIFELYERATREHYVLADAQWESIRPEDHSQEERVGLAYWFAMHGTFESAGILTFARALVASFEAREQDSIRRMLMTVTRDESHHDEMAMRVVQRILPGFPHAFTPRTELERAACRNVAWVQDNIERYWKGYKRAYETKRFQAILSSFASGEAAGTYIFGQIARESTHPIFGELMRHISRDEARHYQLASHLMRRYTPHMTDDEINSIAKNLVASYAYFSVLLDEPSPVFWSQLPPSWTYWNAMLEEKARQAGLGLSDLAGRRAQWRRAMLRVKAITDQVGMDFPAIPALDINGNEVPLTADDVLVVAF